MLLIFTLVWQTDKSLLPKQTEFVRSSRDTKRCAQEAPRGLVQYLAACKLKSSRSDTNHLPGWPVEHFSFSSPWQPPVYGPDTVAATPHTPPSHTQATPSSSAHVLVSSALRTDGHIQLSVTSWLWAMRTGRGGRGRENLASASAYPNTLPSSPFSLWKKHLLALHCISLFKHEGKPFGGHLVVSYETDTSHVWFWHKHVAGSFQRINFLNAIFLTDLWQSV